MNHDSERIDRCSGKKRSRRFVTLALVAIASTIWFVLRTGTKPSRILYPCQQAALANISFFKAVASTSIPSITSLRLSTGWMKPVAILTILSVGGFILTTDPVQIGLSPLQVDSDRVPLELVPQTAANPETASDLFFVQRATGPDGNMTSSVTTLIEMMGQQGLHFYKTSTTQDGLIDNNDVIIIKMNGQWEYRGGTSSDLIRGVINAIIEHPDGFTGEIVIADNGQGLGNLNRYYANSYYQNESAQEVTESFAVDWNISTVLWDDLRSSTVDDYNDGDFENGYVRSSEWNNETNIYPSYPKFQSPATGAYISFKQGVWSNATGFDSDRLKIINMPVLKTHFRYGVTGCIKHYMGVPQGYIVESVDSSIPHEHFAIGAGGMGTLMVETRAPVLNILDMVWVNAHPLESSSYVGPWSRASTASATDIIGASLDPIALDYWSAKHVLIPTAEYLSYSEFTSIDPDNDTIHQNYYHGQILQDESFHNYLERSMYQLNDAGFHTTMTETEMNVFVVTMSDAGPITPTTPDQPDLLPIAIGVVSLGVFVVAVGVIWKRKT
ncbi:MAG: DUF362 domain-containing protein [Candidatus Thorarchaeota archaeon]